MRLSAHVALATAAALAMGGSVIAPTSALDRIAPGPDEWGDFETIGLQPQGWTTTTSSPNRVVVSSSRAISGARSLMVDDTSATVSASARRPRFGAHPGRTYYTSAYAYQTGGNQLLKVNWFDSDARLVGSSSQATSGALMVWQRVSIEAKAPADARYGELEIVSSTAGRGTTWWDAVTMHTSLITNSGVESAPTESEPIPAWAPESSGGATAARSRDQARTGSWSLELKDTTTRGFARATTEMVRVQPSVTHSLRAWIYPRAGSSSLGVVWYDERRQPVKTEVISGSKPTGAWGLIARRDLVAPPDAHYAALRPQTSVAGTAHSYWDAVSLVPAPGAEIPTFTNGDLGSPLDTAAQTKATTTITVDGRLKLAGVVSGEPARLQLVDVLTNRVETNIEIPGMSAGQTIATGRDDRVYFGGNTPSLFRYTPGSTSIEDLGAVTPSARNVLDLEVASDGRVWGGSYPKAEVWAFDPTTSSTSSLGSARTATDYALGLAVDDRYVYAGVGSTRPEIIRIDRSDPQTRVTIPLPTPVTSGNISELEVLGRFLAVKTPSGTTTTGVKYTSERRLYDLTAKTWGVAANLVGQTPSPVDSSGYFYYLSYKQLWAVDSRTGTKTARASTTMPAGRDRHVAAMGGSTTESLIAYDEVDDRIHAIDLDTHEQSSHSVAFAPAPMDIKTLDEGAGGTAYVGGFGGSSLAIVDPRDGTRAQYPKVSYLSRPGVIGELEGAIAKDRFQYIGTYTEGKIFRHDTSQPWVDGTNPELIGSFGPSHQQDRPSAWAISGDRVFFGTVPKYGVLGGALGIIEGDTSNPRLVRDVVPDQSVVSLAAQGDVVFGGTSRWGGLGATPTAAGAKVFAWDVPTGKKLWEVAPQDGVQSFGSITIGPDGTIWTADSGTLYELDPKTGATLRTVMVNPTPQPVRATYQNSDLVFHDGYLYLQALDKVYAIDPVTLRVAAPVPAGVSTRRIALVGGRLLYPSGHTLRQVTIS